MQTQLQLEPDGRLNLPQVTLCAATSVNVNATIFALEKCLAQAHFATCKLFTDKAVNPQNPRILVVPIPKLDSSAAYSEFLLSGMLRHIETPHCLVAQWDGHIVDAKRWRSEFLDYDYIGASWPQFEDGHDVGNGGFSLRSRRLLKACQEPGFQALHPEDMAIGRVNREWLESKGMRFAPRAVADLFAAERAGDLNTTFGYHGVWNMPRAIGAANFWQLYRGLDDRSTIMRDIISILRDVGGGSGGALRATLIALDYLKYRLR